MSEKHPPLAIELLNWIADQKELVTVPPDSDERVQELAEFYGLPPGPRYRKAESPKTARRAVRVTAHGNHAWLSDMPKRFWDNAEPLLQYLDGRRWIHVRVFGYPNLGVVSPDEFGNKFSPLDQADQGYQWGGLLARAQPIRDILEQLPDSGTVCVDDATRKPVPEVGPNTCLANVAGVRALHRLADVQVYVTREGRAVLAEVALLAGAPTATNARPDVNDDSHLSPTKLADVFDVPVGPLRNRLNRWRAKNHEGWIENPDRRPREAKYLYRVGSVRHIIDALKATSETTSK